MARKNRSAPARAESSAGATPARSSGSVTANTVAPAPSTSLPAEIVRGDWTVAIFAVMMFLAPAIGVPYQEMLQDTLKSIVVSFSALGSGLLFFWQLRKQQVELRWHALMWLPLALMVYALGSMVWSHTYLAGVEAIRWFVFSLILWLGLNTLSRERLPLLFWGIHWGAVIASLWTALQFWTDFKFFPQGAQPASTFVNRNFFAEFVVCTLPFSAFLLAQARQTGKIAWLALTIAVNLVALLMTGTRSALAAMWLLLFVVIPLITFLYRKQFAFFRWSSGQRLLAVGVLLVTVIGLGLIKTGNPSIAGEHRGQNALERGIYRTTSVVTDREEFVSGSLSIRLIMWKATGRMIVARPLSGVGAGAWEVDAPLYQHAGAQLETDYYAHNEILQLLAEYGLVGWVTLLGLLGYLSLSAWRTWHHRKPDDMGESALRAVALASLLSFLLVSNAGFPWRLAPTGAIFALGLGILAASDARLGMQQWRPAVRLRWEPAFSRVGVIAMAASMALAAYITQQAAASEYKIVQAVKRALMISRSGDAHNPKWNIAKQEMLQLIQEGTAINPHYRKITPMVADELARWGDWKNALWIWESVVSSRPHVVIIMANIARGYAQTGNNGKALEYLERCKKIQPKAVGVRALEVILLGRIGNEPEATKLAKQYLQEGTYNYDLVNAAWLLGMRNGDYDLAIQGLELRNKDWPAQRVDGFLQLGHIYATQKKDDTKALEAYQAALAAAPEPVREAVRKQITPAYLTRLY